MVREGAGAGSRSFKRYVERRLKESGAEDVFDWHRVDGEWAYTKLRYIYEALKKPVHIDDEAARAWQRQGASLSIPAPTFGPWTIRRLDGTIDVLQP